MARAGGRRAEPGNTKVGQQQVRAIGIFLVVADKKVGRFDILVDNLMVMGMITSQTICKKGITKTSR